MINPSAFETASFFRMRDYALESLNGLFVADVPTNFWPGLHTMIRIFLSNAMASFLCTFLLIPGSPPYNILGITHCFRFLRYVTMTIGGDEHKPIMSV